MMNLPNMAYMKPSMIVRPYESSRFLQNNRTKKLDDNNETSSFTFKISSYIKKIWSQALDKTETIKSKSLKINWKVWIIGIFIYGFILLAAEGDPDELLTEEDHLSLREFVKEVSKV